MFGGNAAISDMNVLADSIATAPRKAAEDLALDANMALLVTAMLNDRDARDTNVSGLCTDGMILSGDGWSDCFPLFS